MKIKHSEKKIHETFAPVIEFCNKDARTKILVAKLFEAHSKDKPGDAMLTMEHLCELEKTREHRKELERQAIKKIKGEVWAKREKERLET